MQTKEEKMIEKWIPFGFMIGTVIGMALVFINDDIIYLVYGIVGGLLFSILGPTIFSGEKIEFTTKKNKKNKKKN